MHIFGGFSYSTNICLALHRLKIDIKNKKPKRRCEITWRADCPVCGGEGEKGDKKYPECYPDTEWSPGGNIYMNEFKHILDIKPDIQRIIY